VKNKDKKPYRKPALVELGKHKIDKEAFENGELGESKEEILRKVKEQQDDERLRSSS
jgi:hypothetical protein